MPARELQRLDQSLEGFLAKLTAGLNRSERRRWAGVYVRGLLLDGGRKSVEPMAMRLGESDQDLHHFVSHSPWSADVLLEALAKTTATTPPAYWIIDETSFPKAGSHSAGVQRQYCGALGKKANCQLTVSLHRADEAAGTGQPLSWRLFLPESWTDDPARSRPPQQTRSGAGAARPGARLAVTAQRRARRRSVWRQLRVAAGPAPARARPLLLRARAVDDHRLAGGTALWRACARAPGLSRQAWTAAHPALPLG